MKFPTIKEMAEEVADKAIDEVEYNGKTLREWMEIIETASEDTISRRAAINVIPKKQNGTGGESWMKTYRRSGHNDCVDACVTALQGLPPVTYTKINPPSDYARQFGLIPKEDATDINVATKDSTNLASLGTDCISRQAAIDAVDSETVSTNPEHFKSSEKFIKFMDDADISSFGIWQWSNGFNTALVATTIQLKKLPSAQPEQTEMIKEIRKWINSANRGNADYFIVDKIEEIINRYE